jgi:hypothetical protein
MAKTGEAYSIFDCRASKKEIESDMEDIRHLATAPTELEITLMETKDIGNEVDPILLQFMAEKEIYATVPSKYKGSLETKKPVKMADMKYVMKSAYPNKKNEDAANELGDIMNVIQERYGNGKPFNVAVIYKIDGEWYSKE